MGLLDHRKTWRYQVHGSPEQCITAFLAAFSGKGGALIKAKWAVKHSSTGAVATYKGRKGLVSAFTALSQTAQDEERAAIGSEVTFEIEKVEEDQTTCTMWLSANATRMGITTNDGRFFRPYMRAVESELRQVDPTVQVQKV